MAVAYRLAPNHAKICAGGRENPVSALGNGYHRRCAADEDTIAWDET